MEDASEGPSPKQGCRDLGLKVGGLSVSGAWAARHFRSLQAYLDSPTPPCFWVPNFVQQILGIKSDALNKGVGSALQEGVPFAGRL